MREDNTAAAIIYGLLFALFVAMWCLANATWEPTDTPAATANNPAGNARAE